MSLRQGNIKAVQKTKHRTVDILLVISHLRGGGSQRVLTTLANAWDNRGKRVGILTFNGLERSFFPLNSAIERVDLRYAPPGPKSLQLIKELQFTPILAKLSYLIHWLLDLRRVIRNSGARVVVSFINATNIKIIIACFGISHFRLVISERNDPLRQRIRARWRVLRYLLYRFADVVTANSRHAVEVMRAYVPERKLAYAPNPLWSNSRAPVVPAEHRPPTVLAVGSLTPKKAYDVLLQAFSLVVPWAESCRLAIVGGGPLADQLSDLVKRLEIESRVDWHGFQADPYLYYRAADIFVMPSSHEGTPNALLEAMSEGLPPIVADTMAGALEFVKHEVTGLVVPGQDCRALAEAIGRLIRNSELRHRLGQNASRQVAAFKLEHVLPVWDLILDIG